MLSVGFGMGLLGGSGVLEGEMLGLPPDFRS